MMASFFAYRFSSCCFRSTDSTLEVGTAPSGSTRTQSALIAFLLFETCSKLSKSNQIKYNRDATTIVMEYECSRLMLVVIADGGGSRVAGVAPSAHAAAAASWTGMCGNL